MQHCFNDENLFVCTGLVTGDVQTPESSLAVFGMEVHKLHEIEGVRYPVRSRFKVVAADEIAAECVEMLSKGTPVGVVGRVEIDEEDLEVHGEIIFREDGVTPVIDKTITIYAREVRVLEEDLDNVENYFDCTGLVTGDVQTPESSLAVFGLAVSKFHEVEGVPYPVPSRFKVLTTNEVADECDEKLSRHTQVLIAGGLEIDEEELKIHGEIIFREDGETPVMDKIVVIHAEDVQVLGG